MLVAAPHIAVIGVGGELVARGAERTVATLSVPALLMGMVGTPAASELEEVIRQAIPTKEGRPDVSPGNVARTLLYFALFNLGLIALLTTMRVAALSLSRGGATRALTCLVS